jgi:lambda family phage portal protein
MSKKKSQGKNPPQVQRQSQQSQGKRRRTYDGARSDRLTADWAAPRTSADGAMFFSLAMLRNRSRDMARNSDYINGLFSTMVNNTVGRGMKFQAQVRRARLKEMDVDLNAKIEAVWDKWCKKTFCHAAGRLDWQDIEQLLMRSLIESGEVFIRKLHRSFAGSAVPFALEILEADQLAEDYNVPKTREDTSIKMGVEMDRWSRVVAYWFYPFHPGEAHVMANANKPERVAAGEVIHLYRMLRPNQTRGVPWLFCSMANMQHTSRYIEGEVVAARLQNAIAGFVERPEDDEMPLGEAGEEGEEKNFLEDLAPGAIEYLNPGEKFQGFAPTRPGGNFDPFVRRMLRGLAAGQGVSYESTSRDYSETSYSSARASLLEERKSYEVLQDWLIRNVHIPLYHEWLRLAVYAGAIKISNYDLQPEFYQECSWIPPGWQWVDPQKDMEAAILGLRAGLTTRKRIVSEQGLDLEEVFQQLALEKDLAKTLGLEFELSTKPKPNQDQTASGDDGNSDGSNGDGSNGKKDLKSLLILGSGYGNGNRNGNGNGFNF